MVGGVEEGLARGGPGGQKVPLGGERGVGMCGWCAWIGVGGALPGGPSTYLGKETRG